MALIIVFIAGWFAGATMSYVYFRELITDKRKMKRE
jgi:hypothetical protein